MKRSTLLLALPLVALAQSCAKSADRDIRTIHDTVSVVTRTTWTDTFIGRYTDDRPNRVDSQIALLHYISADSIMFEMKVPSVGYYGFNVKQASLPNTFQYTAPDGIAVGGVWYGGNGGGFYQYYGVRKK